MRHTVYLTDDQWKIFQELSKQRNPASYIRQVLDRFIHHKMLNLNELLRDAIKTPAEVRQDERFNERWQAIGCSFRKFDEGFNMARRWYVDQFDSENEALTELEERHANGGLHRPRAWIYRQWRDAGARENDDRRSVDPW